MSNFPAPDSPEPRPSAGDTAAFLRIFSAQQPRLFSYVLSLVPNWNDAEEIVQETSVRAWESFSDFTPGTNFGAWVTKIAFHQVLAYRKRAAKAPLPMSDEFLEKVSSLHEALDEGHQGELSALQKCLADLPMKDRELLRRCYEAGSVIKDIAADLGSPAGSIYKTLSRIRWRLFQCIERRLSMESRP